MCACVSASQACVCVIKSLFPAEVQPFVCLSSSEVEPSPLMLDRLISSPQRLAACVNGVNTDLTVLILPSASTAPRVCVCVCVCVSVCV